MSLFDLTGRVAVVTGGNGGIGLGMAEGLAAAGATVVVAARNKEKLAAAVETIQKSGGKAASCDVDVTSRESVDAMVQHVADQFGGLDIMVANAGTNIRKLPQDYSLDEWKQILDLNLTGTFNCVQAAYPHLKASGRGKVITIGSMASLLGLPFSAPYASTKGAVVQLTRVLATAWATDNIQANCILPGWIDTELTRKARVDISGLHERVVDRTPASRWGDPKDFAGISVFLASSASDFVTGTAIPVDGGYSIMGG